MRDMRVLPAPRPLPATFRVSTWSSHLEPCGVESRGSRRREGRVRPGASFRSPPGSAEESARTVQGGSSGAGAHLLPHATSLSLTHSTGLHVRPAGNSQAWRRWLGGWTVCIVLLVWFEEGPSSYEAKQNHITLGWLNSWRTKI